MGTINFGQGGSGGGGAGGGFLIPASAQPLIPFADNTARDAWANANLGDLVNTTTLVQVGAIWYQWLGTSSPTGPIDPADWNDATITVSIPGTAGANGADGADGTNGADGADGVVQAITAGTNTTVTGTAASPQINVPSIGVETVSAGTNTTVTGTVQDRVVNVPSIGVVALTAGTNITLTGTATNPIINSSGGGGGGARVMPPINGRDYFSASLTIGEINQSIALSADNAYLMPYRVDYPGVYSDVVIFINTTGTATKARVALYSITDTLTVDSLLFETADITVSSTGRVVAAIPSGITLTQDEYFIAVLTNGTLTLAGTGAGQAGSNPLGAHTNFSARQLSRAEDSVATAWTNMPASPTLTSDDLGNGGYVLIALRAGVQV